MDWRVASAQHAAERAAVMVDRQMARGLCGLATVAATAPFAGMIGAVWGISHSFPPCGADKSTCMAAIAELLGASIVPAALGLGVAIMASWGYRYLSERMAEFEIEMRNAVRDLPASLTSIL
ncbi:MAG TPA: MotA/TolQ/ExbB proton channel family protein [Bryobacteraceae bacterium]|jgi:biopolymer transport protein ExbB/TolQ